MPPATSTADAGAARPRVEGEREQEIFDATLDVLAEVGYDKLTMDAVAAAARASKATLYRRWESKASLVLEAFSSRKPLGELPDTGSLRGDLIAAHCGRGGLDDGNELAVFSAVLTALGRDATFADAYRRDFIGPRLERTVEIYRRAHERGELREGVDVELVGSALAGIVLHRRFVLGQPATPESIAAVIDQIILPAVSPTPEPLVAEQDPS